MITKFPRLNETGKYNLRVTDLSGNSFDMLVAGNLDLYWMTEARSVGNKTYTIRKSDELLYRVFEKLFEDIKNNDDEYEPSLIGNTFSFISEDCPEEDANRLNIVKEQDKFTINFIKNENTSYYGLPRRGCAIRFCNSGSRVPKIEMLFMKMFTDLAYNNEDIELMQK